MLLFHHIYKIFLKMQDVVDEDFRILCSWSHPNDRISWEIQFHYPVKMCPSNIRIGKRILKHILLEEFYLNAIKQFVEQLEVCLL